MGASPFLSVGPSKGWGGKIRSTGTSERRFLKLNVYPSRLKLELYPKFQFICSKFYRYTFATEKTL